MAEQNAVFKYYNKSTGQWETNYFRTKASQVAETPDRNFVTDAQKANIQNYLTTFNTKNKLVKLENDGKIHSDLINADFKEYLKHNGSVPMSGDLDMAGNDMTNLKAIYLRQDGGQHLIGATKDSVILGVNEEAYRFYDDKIDLNYSRITKIGSPVDSYDAVNKGWVEALVETGTKAVEAAVAATTKEIGNITLSGLVTIDGVVLKDGDRVLVKNQTTKTENGVYLAKSGAWQKVTEDSKVGSIIFVTEGTVNNDSKWFSKAENEWTKFSQTDQLNYTGGLVRVGEYVSIANGGVSNTHLEGNISTSKLANFTGSDSGTPETAAKSRSVTAHINNLYAMVNKVSGYGNAHTISTNLKDLNNKIDTKSKLYYGTAATPTGSNFNDGDIYIQILS